MKRTESSKFWSSECIDFLIISTMGHCKMLEPEKPEPETRSEERKLFRHFPWSVQKVFVILHRRVASGCAAKTF
jgi:hypothetical protein